MTCFVIVEPVEPTLLPGMYLNNRLLVYLVANSSERFTVIVACVIGSALAQQQQGRQARLHSEVNNVISRIVQTPIVSAFKTDAVWSMCNVA